jgi:CubicO group peptidase (beta-lactamase class C family)
MSNKNVMIDGTAAPRFERLKAMFELQMNTLAEENAQLCVYVGEEQVVDLWASAADDSTFGPDSLVNVFSSSKNFEAIALATLVERGLINYDNPIAEYWPEFGAAGKDQITVADLMRHEAGLAAFNTSLDPNDLLTENILKNKIGQIIEQHPSRFRTGPGNEREYHAITRGWIVNELFRRVDPAKRTIGQFLREDLSAPMGADVHIGLKKEQLEQVAPISPLGLGKHLRESLKPRLFGRQVKDNFFQTASKLLPLLPQMRHRTTGDAPPPYIGMEEIEFFNEPIVRMGETPSANAHCSARGLARVAATMACGGTLAGKQYLSQSTWQAMHDNPIRRDMGIPANFTQGGVNLFSTPGPGASRLDRAANSGRSGFYGWMGLGGSIFQWHPEKKIGFAYVPTSLHVLDLVNERGKIYQQAMLHCLES